MGLYDGRLAVADETITELAADHRCVAPTLPLGGASARHAGRRRPVAARGGPAVAEFLDRLDLRDVVLVGNDTGGALVQLMMVDGAARVAGVVLESRRTPSASARADGPDARPQRPTPPGCSGCSCRTDAAAAAAPHAGRLRVAHTPGDAATARWIRPVLERPEIRRDAVRTLRGARPAGGHRPAARRGRTTARASTAPPSSSGRVVTA